MIYQIGSWGTDLEVFLAEQTRKTDIFVYPDSLYSWDKFFALYLLTEGISINCQKKDLY